MIRILIADDHPLIRDALRACIEDEADMLIVAEVETGQNVILKAQELELDVIILDLYLPDLDGISVLKQILAINPEFHVLFFTSSTEDDKVALAIQSGALGYLIKDSQRAEIIAAIRDVSQGRSYLSSTVAAKLANGLRQQRASTPQSTRDRLTNREEDILALVGQGASNLEIASQLNISETTVRTHIHNILQKMGLENRAQLVMHILRQKTKKDNTSPLPGRG